MLNITGQTLTHILDLEEDPRVKEWFLINTPASVSAIIASYLIFVTKLGPALMKNRKPFELKKVMLYYNVLQIVYCTCLVLFSIKPFIQFTPTCAYLQFTTDEIMNAQLAYAFFLLKIIDLLDTVIFVLRKKYNQITFLHTFHHAYIVVLGFLYTKYLAGSQVALLSLLNGIVHVVMYYYYLITSLTKKSIWWKKYLTTMQLVQLMAFCLLMLPSLVNPSCKFPKKFIFYIMLLPNLVLISEFASFYIRSYMKTTKESTLSNATELKIKKID